MRAALAHLPSWKGAVAALGVFLLAAPAWADPPPLPADEQAAVDGAMQRGIQHLKQAQLPAGTWVADGNNKAAYAALPGLTLMACGVPADDPAVKRAAAYVRGAAPAMDRTYDLGLSIVFLDKIGDKADDKLIQDLALRIVAGQSPSGGWGYKCPPMHYDQCREFLALLRHLTPKSDAPDAPPPPAPDEAKKDDPKKEEPKPVSIPAEFRKLIVTQEMTGKQMLDPADKAEDLIFATTCNSNTQFAEMGLWVAQRHDVPLTRTMRLVARRFASSQNVDGGWGYHYRNGGGEPEGPAMDCCGLFGLAAGYGAGRHGDRPANKRQEPEILNGFAALNKFIGAPAGRTRDLPAPNLYFLWAVERVAFLYDLPTIADKDWYRWGAEAVVANQAPDGGWADGGGYPGATPVANTCFALLYLSKANLLADMSAALPFRPDDLAASIKEKVAPPPETKPPEPPPPPKVTAEPPKVKEPEPAPPPAPTSPPVNVQPTAAPPQPAPAESGGFPWLILLIVIAAVLLLASSGVVLLVHFSRQKAQEKAAKAARRKKAVARPDGKAKAPGPNGKKPGGKTRSAT